MSTGAAALSKGSKMKIGKKNGNTSSKHCTNTCNTELGKNLRKKYIKYLGMTSAVPEKSFSGNTADINIWVKKLAHLTINCSIFCCFKRLLYESTIFFKNLYISRLLIGTVGITLSALTKFIKRHSSWKFECSL